MSLKGFHVLFIILSVLCTLGFAAWCFLTPYEFPGVRTTGYVSGALGVGLSLYGAWFVWKKAGKLIT